MKVYSKKKGRIIRIAVLSFLSCFVFFIPNYVKAQNTVESISIEDSSKIIQDQQESNLELKEDGSISASSIYQSKRILIFTDHLYKSYGEIEKYYVEDAGYFFLYFETEEETKNAYIQLKKEYGGSVIIDQVFSKNEILQYASYGTTALGMNILYENIDATTYKDQKVTVAVIDSGFNTSNLLLSGRFSSDSYDMADGDSDISEELGLKKNESVGHGSHVAGIIASSTPSNVDILGVKILDNLGNMWTSYLINGVSYAINKGADVINLSLGIDGDYDFLDELIDSAYEKDCIIVCASGNEAADRGYKEHLVYPANNDKTIAVGAINESKERCSFSDYGEQLDFVATGYNINSATSSGDGLKSLSGTSMACPFIAAEVAYLKMKYPDASFYQCYELLKIYAEDLGTEGFDKYYGWGMPNISTLFDEDMEFTEIKDSTFIYDDQWIYSGEEICPSIIIRTDKTFLIEGKNYSLTYENNKDVGTGTIHIQGKGYYTGQVDKTFTINPKDVSSFRVFVEKDQYEYTGAAITPPVILEGVALGNYTVTYENNVSPGTATIIIKGIGNYCGEIRTSFTISQINSFNTPVTVSLIGQTFQIGKNTYQITEKNKVTLIKCTANSKTITVPNTVTYQNSVYRVSQIASKVFYKKKAKKIVIGSYVEKIGTKTFAGCKNLKTIVCKGKLLKSVGKGTSKKVKIKCPKSVEKKYRKIWRR